MNGQLDVHFIGMLEQKIEKSRFVRVDSDVIDNIIPSPDKKDADLTAVQRNILTTVFKSQIPAMDKSEFFISFEAVSPDAQPVVITQSEYMRRMKDMAALQPGMSFYGELPDSYNLTLNTNHPVVKSILGSKVEELENALNETNAAIKSINDAKKDAKELDEAQKQQLADNEAKAADLRKQETDLLTEYAGGQDRVKQLVDIALLGNGMLKGEALSKFLQRSISLL
jgi:molecular chaperone HtpG